MKAIESYCLLGCWLARHGPQSLRESSDGGPETTLNAAVHYVDGIFVHTLASLELIASTPEAQNKTGKASSPI